MKLFSLFPTPHLPSGIFLPPASPQASLTFCLVLLCTYLFFLPLIIRFSFFITSFSLGVVKKISHSDAQLVSLLFFPLYLHSSLILLAVGIAAS